jgi:hypothetical protein
VTPGLAATDELNGFGASEVLVGIPTEEVYSRPGQVEAYSIGCSANAIASYCTTSPSSVGAGATIASLGPSSLAANDLRLEAHDCPAGQFGIFYCGSLAGSLPFGDGTRCVTGTSYRLPAVSMGSGVAGYSLAHGSLPVGGELLAGARWDFQFGHRNPVYGGGGFGGAGFNLSDALSVEFCL